MQGLIRKLLQKRKCEAHLKSYLKDRLPYKDVGPILKINSKSLYPTEKDMKYPFGKLLVGPSALQKRVYSTQLENS